MASYYKQLSTYIKMYNYKIKTSFQLQNASSNPLETNRFRFKMFFFVRTDAIYVERRSRERRYSSSSTDDGYPQNNDYFIIKVFFRSVATLYLGYVSSFISLVLIKRLQQFMIATHIDYFIIKLYISSAATLLLGYSLRSSIVFQEIQQCIS